MPFSLKIAAGSNIGLVRTTNQDSAYTSPHLIVVADGMGGAAAGDLASSIAIHELAETDQHHAESRLSGEDMLEAFGGAIAKANDDIADLVASNHSYEGMGTTVCGVMFSGEQFGLCHIGDSRGYLLRDGQLSRLTHDHSFVQSLVDEGKLRPEEAAEHPHRSLLLRVMNGHPSHRPDSSLFDAQLGDRLLFCSDGLCGLIDDGTIDTLLREGAPDEALESLTQAAYGAGGNDNVTIIVADVVQHDPELDAAAPVVLGAAASVTIPTVGADAVELDDLGPQPDEAHVPKAPKPQNAADPEEIRYRPQVTKRSRRFLPFIIATIAIVALAAGALFGARAYIAAQFYIGRDGEHAAIFQGVPDQVLGIELSHVAESSDVVIDDLPPFYADRVRAGELRYSSADEARDQIDHLDELATKCRQQREAKKSGSTPSDRPDLEECG